MAATNFSQLCAYARKIGAHVRRSGTYACWHREEKVIYLPTRLRGRDALFTLLHEVGHVLVDRKGRFDQVDAYVSEHSNAWRGRAWAVAEEWEAWEAGRKLAERLSFRIDLQAFDKFAAAHVAAYVHEAGTAPFGGVLV